jgi:hypothetical protein
MAKTGPYVGLTGITTLAEYVACDRAFYEATKALGEYVYNALDLKFMGGILVSEKTLYGGKNKWRNRYPPIERLPEILSLDRPYLMHTIHYNTDTELALFDQVCEVIERAKPSSVHALQLNVRWAKISTLHRIRRYFPDLRIILQVGAGALSDVQEHEDMYLGDVLRSYDGLIDDFLVDPSGGKGEELDVWRAFACIADDEIPRSMRPGMAGGFDAATVPRAKGVMRRLKRPVNLDAEGKVRTPKDETTEPGVILGDYLDIPKSQQYIAAAVQVAASTVPRQEAERRVVRYT